ncbi:MAG: efflux RND transporter permease subunit [Idiomarina sp.]|nr:efflux RND transporter permease subunit [Idiomarina sp.]
MPDSSSSKSKHGLSAWSIRRPLSTLALTAVVLVLGVLFAGRMPVDLLPQVDYPHIRVVVNYPGVTPEVIEEQVTRPLERNLSATENLSEIHGRASEGRSYIEMYFAVGTDIDMALQDAARQLERARTELPAGIEPPRLMKMDPALDPVFELAFTSPVRDAIELRDWVDQRLMPQLLAVAGVGAVEIAGGKEREIDIQVDPERMHSYGLSLAQVGQLVSARNIDQPIGNVTGADYDIMGRTQSRYRNANDVAQTLIPVNDQFIRLQDIATIEDSHREQRLFAFVGDEPAVQVSIMKQPQANTVQVIDDLKSRLEQLQASGFISADIDYQVIRDSSFFITASIRSVATAALIGGLLATLVIWFFLGSFKRAMVIASVIPIAITATVVVMTLGNMTLNILTLGAMALGIGLLIDNAIVMVENIFRHQQDGEGAADAAGKGAYEVQSAVIAGSTTNLAAVVPFLLIGGLAAMLFREFILTIGIAIIAALIAALTVVPALCAKLRFTAGRQRLASSRGYARVLHWVLAHPLLVVIVVLLLVLASGLGLRGMTSDFLPPVDDGRVTMRFTLPSGTSIEPTNEAATLIRQTVADMPHVAHQYQTVGGYFRGGQLSIRGGMIDMVVQLDEPSSRRGYSANQWVADFRRKVNELQLPFVQQRVRGPSIEGLRTSLVDTDIAVGVIGEDLDALERQAYSIMRHIQGLAGVSDVQVGRDEKVPQLMVRVDEERARQFGYSSEMIAAELYQGIEGLVAGQYVEGGFEYNIRLRYPRDITGQVATLQYLQLPLNQAGAGVPLASLVQFEEVSGPAHIERFNQIRVVWTNITVDQSTASVGEVGRAVRDAATDVELDEGYSLVFAGEQEAIEESSAALQLAIGLAVFFVLVVLIVQYERLFSALVIMISLPVALLGVVIALRITGLGLSIPVLLGVVFLAGIVVNNAILLVEFAEQKITAIGTDVGDHSRKEIMHRAISEAAQSRLRPVLMTTLTTVVGMLPLAIGIGQGSELMQPLAVTVIGGLLVGTFLTLLIIPAFYMLLSRFRKNTIIQ